MANRAACEVSEDSEIWIFGSQAILGEFPNAPEALRASNEVDVQPKNRPDNGYAIDGVLGELSLFHQTHGFYVHGMPIEEAATLPPGLRHKRESSLYHYFIISSSCLGPTHVKGSLSS
jgi:hypothetical protein